MRTISARPMAGLAMLILAGAVVFLVCLSDSAPPRPVTHPAVAVSGGSEGAGSGPLRAEHRVTDLVTEVPQRVPVPEPIGAEIWGYQVRDVRDLTLPKPRIGGGGGEAPPFVAMDLLVSNLKDVTGASYWDSELGGRIDRGQAGYLVVQANPEMRQRVDRFLEDLRQFASTRPK